MKGNGEYIYFFYHFLIPSRKTNARFMYRRREEIAAAIAKRHELPDWSEYIMPLSQAEDVYHRNMSRMLDSEHRAVRMAVREGKKYEPRYKFSLSMLGRYGWC